MLWKDADKNPFNWPAKVTNVSLLQSSTCWLFNDCISDMKTKVVHVTDDVCAMVQVVGQWPITLEVHIQFQELVVD